MLRLIFGGTFDPIHWGHLRPAMHALVEIGADTLQLMPSAQPPHRDQIGASAQQRLEMVQLACSEIGIGQAESWEIDRDRRSYSLLTLREMRQQWPQDTLLFLMGNDAFAALDTWYHWQDLLNYCHIVVMQRPHHERRWSSAVEAYYQQHRAQTTAELKEHQQGLIVKVETPAVDVSATQIRAAREYRRTWQDLVPDAVAHYIQEHQLYQSES